MSIKIIEEKENPLFNRKEIKGSIKNEIAPSKVEVEKSISEKYSTPTANIAIRKILGKFGSKDFEITAMVYKTKEKKEKIEIKTRKQREAEKKAAEEAAKTASEEKKKVAETKNKSE